MVALRRQARNQAAHARKEKILSPSFAQAKRTAGDGAASNRRLIASLSL
jgi:hypothetical protein